jgi:hypothetical protein
MPFSSPALLWGKSALSESTRTPADLTTHQAVVYEQRGGGTAWTFRQGTTETSVTYHFAKLVELFDQHRLFVLGDGRYRDGRADQVGGRFSPLGPRGIRTIQA